MVWQWSFRYLRSQHESNCMVPTLKFVGPNLKGAAVAVAFAPHETAAWFLKTKSLKMSGPNISLQQVASHIPITMKYFSNTANLSFLIMAELISWENWTEGDIKVCNHKNWRDFRVPWQERKECIRNYQEHSGTKGVQQFGSEILCRRFWVISCLCCLRIGNQTFFSQLGWVKRVLGANERPGRFCVLSWYFFQQSILSLVRWGEFDKDMFVLFAYFHYL